MPNTNVLVSGSAAAPNGASIALASQNFLNGSSVGQSLSLTLSSTPTTVTIPSGAQFAQIVPPSNNSVKITIKGASGDAGIAVHPIWGALLGLDPSVTSFEIVAASAMTEPTQVVIG